MKILSIFTGRSDHTERDRFIHLLERSAALYYRTRGYVLFMRESVAKKRADGSRKKKQMRLNFNNIICRKCPSAFYFTLFNSDTPIYNNANPLF